MVPRLGEVIHQARQFRKVTLRQLSEQVTKDDGTPISPQYLNDIELHHRVPTPHMLREFHACSHWMRARCSPLPAQHTW